MTTDRTSPSLAPLAAAPRLSRRHLIATLAASTALPAIPALAQFRVEIKGVGLTQLPIAIAPFRGEAQSPQKISASCRPTWSAAASSWRRCFRSRWTSRPRPRPGPVAAEEADSLVTGSAPASPTAATTCASGCGTWSRARDLGGQSFVITQGDLRLAAHRIADFIYEKLTGERAASSPPASPTSPSPADATASGWPMPTARTRSPRSPAPSPSSRRPGRPPAASWPMCRSNRASPSSTFTTWPPAAAA